MPKAEHARESSKGRPEKVLYTAKLEVIVIPVSDVDRAKEFYERLGWRLDADFASGDGFRVIQLTPAGSGCSVIFGKNVTAAAPGSAQGLYLIVSDIEAARDDLLRRGVEISEVFHGAADDRNEMPWSPVEVGDEDIPKALGRERLPQVLEKARDGRPPEGERARLGDDVRRRVDPGKLQKDSPPVTLGKKAQGALRQALPFQGIGSEREVRPVHLERRAGCEDDAVRPLELIKRSFREALPADHAGSVVRFHAPTLTVSRGPRQVCG